MSVLFKPLDLLSMPLEGSHLIEASAGTGKTFTIANLYLRLILEKSDEVRKILVVTFTEAATRELRDRIRRNLNEAFFAVENMDACTDDIVRNIVNSYLKNNSRENAGFLLRKAVTGFDEAAILTIHGFCNRMLCDNSFESATLFDTELVTDQTDLIQEIIDDFWRTHINTGSDLLPAIAVRGGLDPDGFMRFSELIINKPGLQLLPAQVSQSWENLEAVFSALQAEWERSSGQITQILHSDTALRRDAGNYKKDRLDILIDHLVIAFDTGPIADSLAAIASFATSTMEGALKKNKKAPGHVFFNLCESFLQAERQLALGMKLDFAKYLKAELKKRKREKNVQSFDDLLSTLRDSLKSAQGAPLAQVIRNNFRAVLIDEFQDTDPIQYEIFEALFNVKDHSLFLIGDPKQSIYGFRGADIFSYIEAVKKTPPHNRYTLSTNFRSETRLIEGVNQLFNIQPNPFVLGDAITFNRVQAASISMGNREPLTLENISAAGIMIWLLGSSPEVTGKKSLNKNQAREKVVQAVVSEISKILALSDAGLAKIGRRPVRPSDFAILVTRNSDALLFKEPLARLNIPAVLAKSGNIFETEEAMDMELILHAAAAPGNMGPLNAALSSSMIGCSGEMIRSFVEEEDSLEAYETHISNFTLYHERWRAKGFIQMFRVFLSDYNVRQKLLNLPFGRRRLTNIYHLAELIHQAAVEKNLGVNGVLSWISEQRYAALSAGEEQELRLERDDEAVQILTIFKSKGLQYPIVFCPFMWQQGAGGENGDFLFHDNGQLFMDLDPEKQGASGNAQARKERLAELIRLLYVAVTRAQNRCYLAWGKIGRPAANALDYLFFSGPEETDLLVEALKDKTRKIAESDFFSAVNHYVVPSERAVRAVIPEENGGTFYQQKKADLLPNMKWRPFDDAERICKHWSITSYSRLTAQELHPLSMPLGDDLKHDEPAGPLAAKDERPASGFFAFPKGPVAGTCIHRIFEKLDFSLQDPLKARVLIQNTLKEYDLEGGNTEQGDESGHVTVLYEMIHHVLQAPLLSGRPEFSLSKISKESCLSELEFYFPLKKLTPRGLASLLNEITSRSYCQVPSGETMIGRLEFKPVQGFMQGFIDLVFCFQGKYYLLDWKTNHLGNSYEDYRPEKLQSYMAQAFYDFQAYIYSVALHKYLAARLPDYTYQKNFGGLFYLFLRGVHPDYPESGIFYDRPSEDWIQALSGTLGGDIRSHRSLRG